MELPSSNGREQRGTRPAIIIADADANISVLIPFTTNIQALRFPNTLEIEPNETNGLERRSVALIFQIRAIDEKRIKNKIGRLEEGKMRNMDKILKSLLQL